MRFTFVLCELYEIFVRKRTTLLGFAVTCDDGLDAWEGTIDKKCHLIDLVEYISAPLCCVVKATAISQFVFTRLLTDIP